MTSQLAIVDRGGNVLAVFPSSITEASLTSDATDQAMRLVQRQHGVSRDELSVARVGVQVEKILPTVQRPAPAEPTRGLLVLGLHRDEHVLFQRDGADVGWLSVIDIRGHRVRLGFRFPPGTMILGPKLLHGRTPDSGCGQAQSA